MRLIDADVLLEKFAGLEATALDMCRRHMYDDDLTLWKRWSVLLAERTAYKYDVVDAPTVDEPCWIPCSERLPEEDGLYLVTSREKATAEEFGFDLDDVEVRKMRFNEDGWRIPKHIPEWINGVVHTTVLAWMPLPEPYKEDDHETD